MSPQRIQRSRQRGWRKPPGAVIVSRPTVWGNPFPVAGDWITWTAVGLGYMGHAAGRRQAAVALHRAWLTGEPVQLGPQAGSTRGGHLEFADGSTRSLSDHVHGFALAATRFCEAPTVGQPPADLVDLRGHDLVCWCPLDQLCHADALLEVANA